MEIDEELPMPASPVANIDFGVDLSLGDDGNSASVDGKSKQFNYELRKYQEELFREVLQHNLIVCLPTNSGKTLIAVSLIRAKLIETKGHYPEVARRSFFLAPTRCLVEQQFQVIKNLVPATSCFLTGEHNVDIFDVDQWNEYLVNNQVIVLTPIVLVDLFTKGLITMSNINLIVVDEAHWALKKNNRKSLHPYRILMDIYKEQCSEMPAERRPRILALSASLLNSQIQIEEFEDTLKSIETIYQARASTRDISQFYNESKIFVNHYHNVDSSAQTTIAFDFERALAGLRPLARESSLINTFRKMLEKVRDILYYRMGPWCAIELINLYQNSLPNLPTEFANCLGTLLRFVQDKIRDRHAKASPTEGGLALHRLSNKLDSLLKLLSVYREELNCIIFVDERTDANVLFRWLEHLSKQYPTKYGFIKVGFICGTLKKGFVRFDDITKDFKKKAYDKELNILVATSVLEEGIDVPLFNVVIRYDFPKTYRAFCQSKGRARYRNSFYILMIDPQLQENWNKMLCKYNQIDQRLRQLTERHQLEVNQEDVDEGPDEDGFGQMFKTEFGMLFERDSIRLLTNYLDKLPADFFTENKPNFIELVKIGGGSGGQQMETQEIVVSSTNQQAESGGANQYCYVFVFPINSSISGVVKGQFKANKRQAKYNCAFQVCKLLLERGEIDHHLNIIKSDFILYRHAAELNLKVQVAVKQSTATQPPKYCPSKAIYDCYKSTFFTGRIFSPTPKSLFGETGRPSADSSTTSFFQYSIHFECVNFESTGSARSSGGCTLHSQTKISCELCPPGSSSSSSSSSNQRNQSSFLIGFLSPHRLPTVAIDSFIYHNLVCIKFKIKYNYEIRLSEEKMVLVHSFHNHVLGKVLWNRNKSASKHKGSTAEMDTQSSSESKPKQLSEITNFYLVPLARNLNILSINFNIIEQLIDWEQKFNSFNLRKKRVSLSPSNFESQSPTPSGDDADVDSANDNLVKCFDESETLFGCFTLAQSHLYYFKNISTKYPDSLIANSATPTTFVDFYQQQYGFSITRLKTPLIHAGRASTVSREFNIVAKQGRKEKNQKVDSDGKEVSHLLFPYEFLLKYPLNRSAYHTLSTVPALFYRLEQYLIAYQLQLRLSSEIECLQLDFDEISVESLFVIPTNIANSSSSTSSGTQLDSGNSDQFRIIDIDQIDLKQNRISDESQLSKMVNAITPLSLHTEFESDRDQPESEVIDQILGRLRDILATTQYRQRDQRLLTEQLNQAPLQYSETSLLFFDGDISAHINIHLDSYNFVKCPNPWHMVKALTLAKSNDLWNMERLETIGDSFLKMSTALYLYLRFLNYDEGKLQKLKDAMVCNENLFKLALERGLEKYTFGKPLARFNLEQRQAVASGAHLVSPPMVAPSMDDSDDKDDEESDDDEIDSATSDKPNKNVSTASQHPFRQELKDKNIADCVESLLGTFLIHGSAGTAVSYLRWLGLEAFDPSQMNEQITDPVNYYQKQLAGNLKELDDDELIGVRLQTDLATLVLDSYKLFLLDEVEEIVGYQFRQKYFLVQAFTHPTFSTIEYTNQSNLITSYQRLEFIGDAILDYIITHYIYLNDQSLTPFQITVLRSALVNNAFYASVVVKYNLHKYLRYSSQALAKAIGNFVKKYKIQALSQLITLLNCATEELETVYIDEIDIPKALADIFEALIGAIFVDNGLSLDHVWRIVYRMIKPEVDYLLKNIPMMPLAWLEKQFTKKYNFSSVQKCGDRMQIELSIGQNRFVGYGQNKQQCKLSAAKRALEHFERRQTQPVSC